MGRHKACPYRCLGDCGFGGCLGQARGLPLQVFGGLRLWGVPWAGTRPAPTGVWGIAALGGALGRHEACPYRCLGDCGFGGCLGQARGLPLRVVALVYQRQPVSRPFRLSRKVGHAERGVAGEIPPHKGGPKARPHRTTVDSDQWPEATALAPLVGANWLQLSHCEARPRGRPNSGLQNIGESWERNLDRCHALAVAHRPAFHFASWAALCTSFGTFLVIAVPQSHGNRILTFAEYTGFRCSERRRGESHGSELLTCF